MERINDGRILSLNGIPDGVVQSFGKRGIHESLHLRRNGRVLPCGRIIARRRAGCRRRGRLVCRQVLFDLLTNRVVHDLSVTGLLLGGTALQFLALGLQFLFELSDILFQ